MSKARRLHSSSEFKGKISLFKPDHARLSIARKCELLPFRRSGGYYPLGEETPYTLELMQLLDEQHLKTPCCGARHLRWQGRTVNRKHIRQPDAQLKGLSAIHQKPNTSVHNTKSISTCCVG